MADRPGRPPARRALALLLALVLGWVGVDLAPQQRPVQARGLRVGLCLQLAPQRLAQLVVLRQRLLAATGRDEQPHQRAVRFLVQRIDDDDLVERLDGRPRVAVLYQPAGELEQQSEMRLAQRLAPAGCPRFVAVFGEQLAAVEGDGRVVVRELAGLAGARDRRFEGVDVDLHRAPRVEHQHVVAQRQHVRSLRAVRRQRAPGDVERLVEVVGGRLGRPVGPQQLGSPLSMDATLRRQREQLDQALGLTQAPRALGHVLLAHANREGAEQPNLHDRAHCVAPSLREPAPGQGATPLRAA